MVVKATPDTCHGMYRESMVVKATPVTCHGMYHEVNGAKNIENREGASQRLTGALTNALGPMR